MTDFDHKGGPPDTPLTAKLRLECIRSILDRHELTAHQKCIGAMMVLQADKEWSAEIKTAELAKAASVTDRETVFRATKKLDHLGIISKQSARGQAGKFRVLPPKIVDAVVEAFAELQSSRVNPDQSRTKKSGETGRHKQSVSEDNPVRSEPTTLIMSVETGPVEPDQSGETGRVQADQPSRVEDNKINNNYNNLPSIKLSPSEQDTAREGEEHVGNGVFVNCETVRHAKFTISLKAIELRLCGAMPMARIKAITTAQAIEWAADLQSGRRSADKLPANMAAYIVRSIKREATHDTVAEVQIEKIKAAPAPRVIGGKAEPKRESVTDRRARALGLTPKTPPEPSGTHADILDLIATEIKP